MKPTSVPSHVSQCGIPLTIAFEECIIGGLFASSTEFLGLVHQSLLDCIVSIEHHNRARSKVDGEYGTIALTELMWSRWEPLGELFT